jgi:hypothetical protein
MNIENLEELRKALESGDTIAISRTMPWGMQSYQQAQAALQGFQSRQPEVDDLKGMIALLVGSLRECTGDIHQLLRVAKYNLTGECVGQMMKIPDPPQLIHETGIKKSEAVIQRAMEILRSAQAMIKEEE